MSIMSEDGFYGWINVVIASLCLFAGSFIQMSFGLFLPSFVNELGWGRGSISGAASIFMLLMGLTSPLAGIFITKRGGRTAIVLGNLLCMAGLLLLAYQRQLWHLYVGYGILMGIGLSFGNMLAVFSIINNWFVAKRSLALSLTLTTMGLGGVVCQPVLASLMNSFGWRQTYLMIIPIIFIFSVLLPGLFLRNKPSDLGQVPDGLASKQLVEAENIKIQDNLCLTSVDFTVNEALQTPTFWFLTAFGAMMMFVFMALLVHFVSFQLDINIAVDKAALAMGLLLGIYTLGQLVGGFLGLKLNLYKLGVFSAVVMLLGMIVLMFSRSLPMVLSFGVVFGIGFGIFAVTSNNLIVNYFGLSHYPKILGLSMMFNTLVSSAGPAVAGVMRDQIGNYFLAIQMLVVVLIIALVCMILARQPIHHSQTSDVNCQRPVA